jgi:hypothetical protein
MTIVPAPDPSFELPPPEECEEFEAFIVLEVLQELRMRFLLWQDRYMVEFAVMQITRSHGQWRQVARIDTKHAHVHRHQLHKANPDDTVGDVQSLEEIPADRGWDVIDRWYEEALKLMQNEWQDNLRRWKGDRP